MSLLEVKTMTNRIFIIFGIIFVIGLMLMWKLIYSFINT